jgi:hypothetical protein
LPLLLAIGPGSIWPALGQPVGEGPDVPDTTSVPGKIATAPTVSAADTGLIAGPIAPAALEDTLFFLDIDSTLIAGQGLLLAFEDTIPFDKGTLDTVLVTAPRVKLSEVIRKIGERMAEERARMREHSFTSLIKVVAHEDEKTGSEHRWATYEMVERYRLDRVNGDYQRAVVWQRERKYRGDEMVKEKVDDQVETQWRQMGSAVMEATPFSLESGNEYNYEILDRKLAGLRVIYKIGYEPKSRFKALSSGTVWIDYGDFVIQRVEARMTDAVPMPMFIKAIPVYKMRRVPKGDFWVIDDLYAEIQLRDVPLLKIPRSVEFYHRSIKHIINGVAFPDGPGAEDPRHRMPESGP